MEFVFMMEADQTTIFDVGAYVLSQLPELGDNGLSGYVYVTPRMENPVPTPGAPEEIAAVFGVLILQDTSDDDDILKLWSPVNNTVHSRWPGMVENIQRLTAFGSYSDWLELYYDNRGSGVNSYVSSRLLDNLALTSNLSALANAIKSTTDVAGRFTGFLVSGQGVRDAPIRGGGNAVSPAWRDAYVLTCTRLNPCLLVVGALS